MGTNASLVKISIAGPPATLAFVSAFCILAALLLSHWYPMGNYYLEDQFSFPSFLAVSIASYFGIIAGLVVPTVLVRLRVRSSPYFNWQSLLVVLYPALVWITLSIEHPEGKSAANLFELPVLGLTIGLAIVALGRRMQTWTQCVCAAWMGCMTAFALWAFVPYIRYF